MTPASSRPTRSLLAILCALTALTGLLDAVSYLRLGHVFAANMTGNVVFLGFAATGDSGTSAPSSLLAIAAFIAGAGLGGLLARRYADRRRAWLGRALGAQAVLLAAAAALLCSGVVADHGWSPVLLTLLSAGFGLQNATVTRLAMPSLRTTVLTLSLTGLASDWARGITDRDAMWHRIASAVIMGVGAAVGAFLVTWSVTAVVALAAMVLAGAAIVVRYRAV